MEKINTAWPSDSAKPCGIPIHKNEKEKTSKT